MIFWSTKTLKPYKNMSNEIGFTTDKDKNYDLQHIEPIS